MDRVGLSIVNQEYEMLISTNGTAKHVAPLQPHYIVVPSRREALQAWENIMKRIKQDTDVEILNRYLLTR